MRKLLVAAGLLGVLGYEPSRSLIIVHSGISPRPIAAPQPALVYAKAVSRSVDIIIARPLFTSGRSLAVAKDAEKTRAEKLPSRVAGIMLNGQSRRALLVDNHGKTFVLGLAGGFGDWTLSRIDADNIELTDRDSVRRLYVNSDAARRQAGYATLLPIRPVHRGNFTQ